MKKSKKEEIYNEIVKFYDLAEDIIDAIERDGAQSPEIKTEITEPVIKQVEESTEILQDVFIRYVESGYKANDKDSKLVDTAIRKICSVLLDFKNAADDRLVKQGSI